MQNAKTINVISTPNISGNIGSCTTSFSNSQTGNTFMTSSYTTIGTNSCTGEVISKDVFTTYDGYWFLIIVGIILSGVMFLGWVSHNSAY